MENNQSLDFYDENNENLDIYPELNAYPSGALPIFFQSTTTTSDVEMQEATELVSDDDDGPSEDGRFAVNPFVAASFIQPVNPGLLRPFAEDRQANVEPKNKDKTLNLHFAFQSSVLAKTTAPVINSAHSVSVTEDPYSNSHIELPLQSVISVSTTSVADLYLPSSISSYRDSLQAKADENPAATINEENYYVYVRTLTPVAQADISKIERIGKANFIGDEHVVIYSSFLKRAKIIRSDTQVVMNLSCSEKRKIYSRDGSLFLPMDSGKQIKVETRPSERPPEQPATAINDKDYVYVRTLMPVAPEDLSKIEEIGKGKTKFIGDERVMTYGGFLNHAKIIRSDTREEMDLSRLEKKKIYSRDGCLFLMNLGEEIEVETCPFEKPVTAIKEENYYVYVRTLTPVEPEDISKIEEIERSKFIGDEHVMTYASFLQGTKIIRSDTGEEMDLSRPEKMKIYSRDGSLFLPMDSGKEIEVETCPFERTPEKPVATINEEDYVYVRTLTPVVPEDISKIEQVGKGKVKFIGDEHVMIYGSFLKGAKIIRSDTQAVMALSFSEKKKIYSRDGSLFLPMDLGEEIEVETCLITRPDKKRKHKDITEYNESEDADVAAPAAKKKKMEEEAAITSDVEMYEATELVSDDEGPSEDGRLGVNPFVAASFVQPVNPGLLRSFAEDRQVNVESKNKDKTLNLHFVFQSSALAKTTAPVINSTHSVSVSTDPYSNNHVELPLQSVTSVSTTSVVDPHLPSAVSSYRDSEQAKADESPIEKPAAAISEKAYMYVRTLTPVAQADISKIEEIGRVKFIGDEHVMIYSSFLKGCVKIIRSDTQVVMNLSRSEKRKIYSRDGSLFLPMDSGEEIPVETRPFERPPEKPAAAIAAINEEDYIYVRTLMPVAPEDISKIEQVGKGTVKFIGDEHVMTYESFLKVAKIIRSDTQAVMDLSYSERKRIYSRDGNLFLPINLGKEIAVKTCPFEKPVTAIEENYYVYARTLTPVAPEDISKIEEIGRFKFIGDEHVITYGGFLRNAKIIRLDTQKEMHLSHPEKRKIYSRDGSLFLPMDSGKEIVVETCPIKRPAEKPVATINEEDYVYARTLTPVAPEDLSKIEQVGKGKAKFVDDEHVMTYGSFLRCAKIIRSDTQEEIDLSRSERKKIYCRDGSLFLPMDLGEEIKVETCPAKRPDKKRKHEDITKHNESEDVDVAAPSAKRKKIEGVAETAIVSRNKNRFFRKKLNINDDKNSDTEDADDYDIGEAQNGPR